jgi:hypothetical protein
MALTRLFTDAARAKSAESNLLSTGYERKSVRLITSADAHSAADLTRHGVASGNARHYAERIAAGATLLIVEAPFGTAGHATAILNAAGGTEDEADHTRHETMEWDDATPLSSAFGWKVLSHDPAPLSHALGMGTLSNEQRGKAKLSHNPAPLSSMLGLKLLSGNAAPFSRMLGLPVLSSKPAPLSAAVGAKTLTASSGPLTVSGLSHDPAPLSNLLGIPTLIHED